MHTQLHNNNYSSLSPFFSPFLPPPLLVPRLRLVKSEQLPSMQGKACQVIVEATLYHGDKPLCPTITTAARTLEHTVRWKETLNFRIKKKNIPKVLYSGKLSTEKLLRISRFCSVFWWQHQRAICESVLPRNFPATQYVTFDLE